MDVLLYIEPHKYSGANSFPYRHSIESTLRKSDSIYIPARLGQREYSASS